MSDIVTANILVDRACAARLGGNNTEANKLLAQAADLYEKAGEEGEAQSCRMLITQDCAVVGAK